MYRGSDSCYVLTEEPMKSQQGNYLQRFGIAEQFKPTTHYRNTEVKCDGFTLGNTTQSSE